MPINFLHGPWYFDWDTSIIKNIRITEKTKLQLCAEVQYFERRPLPLPGQFASINSSTCGRTTATFPASRVIPVCGPI